MKKISVAKAKEMLTKMKEVEDMQCDSETMDCLRGMVKKGKGLKSMKDLKALREESSSMTEDEVSDAAEEAKTLADLPDIALITEDDKVLEAERRRLEAIDKKWNIKEVARGSK